MKVPQHVAIIMDGNGRWAKLKNKDRSFGHKNGVKPVRDCIEIAIDLGIKYLTLYSFSTENWKRPKDEVNSLMNLLSSSINSELDLLLDNQIKLLVIGDLDRLPEHTKDAVESIIDATKDFNNLTLTIAISYSSKWEITEAIKNICKDSETNKLSTEDITEDTISEYLQTSGTPDPDLLIRSGGEKRISNFLLWQLAYSELYFCDTLWPDFGISEFKKAIDYFASKERRYGKTTAQIKS